MLTTALGMAVAAYAQVSHGGQPAEWLYPNLDRGMLATVDFGALEPEEAAPVEGEFRYGVQRFKRINVLDSLGRWDVLPGGGLVCRLALRSPGAVMLSVQFEGWELNEGDLVFLYDAARTRFIGGFDASNRQSDGSMSTAVLPGDEVVIEYRARSRHHRPSQLHVASITHGTVDLFGFTAESGADEDRDINPGFQSSPCQINVICPEAANWQDEKRSVALFLRADGGGCSGNLMNNTQSPRKPYFQLALHCYQPTTPSWVFYFNYESPACVGSVGPSDQTLTGCTVRAADYYRDMMLVELSSDPPSSYNVYYAGWDRSGATPQSTVVIQHPMYDVKKIAFNNDPSTSYTDAIGVQAWRGYWDQGLVQAISSGSPLFDQNRRFIGHMYDGAQVCSTATSVPTDCAKFGPMWDGPSPAERMRDWLNPANNLTVMDGAYAVAPTVQVRPRVYLEGPYDTGTSQMNATLRANGLVPLTEPYTSAGYSHVGGGGGETTTSTVLNVTGNNAVVDWVVVELRSALNNAQVLATRSALLQADGDIVSATDGSSAVALNVPSGSYFVAIRHRNHLGVMTASAVALTSAAATIDMSNGSISLFGGAEATKPVGGRNVMYAGDALHDGVLKYTGTGNDRDPILIRIGGTVPTATANGYFPEDVNLDGVVRYTGTGNDRDAILVNIGGTVPTALRAAQLP
ncbi:MAG: hypothetical protein IPM12_11475 [Flavobacteriales bacterium]|nr:hypothetical protein [Flavobacteriales bacterium]